MVAEAFNAFGKVMFNKLIAEIVDAGHPLVRRFANLRALP
jgi:hypothetical protein